MSITKKVKIKDWEICCNTFLYAYLYDAVEFDEQFNDFTIPNQSKKINYCPYCGVKIPKL